VWYVVAHDSHAAIGESMKREDKDPVLTAELNRLALADAEYVSRIDTILAMARPELSVGSFPDIANARFFEITTLRVRPGREMQFEEVAKAYAAAMKRAAPGSTYRMYEVLAGMEQPTFYVFSSTESYGEFDQRLVESQAAFKQATPEEMAALNKFGEVAERVENNHFRLDPAQSYVPQETRDKDPEFWNPK
jgi:hypothetical protein